MVMSNDTNWYFGWWPTINRSYKLGFAEPIDDNFMRLVISVAKVIKISDDEFKWFVYNGWDAKGTADTFLEAILYVEDHIKKTPFDSSKQMDKQVWSSIYDTK